EAIRRYQQALKARDQPPLANVQTKANAGIGAAYTCLTQALVGDYTADARPALEAVVSDYVSGNTRVRHFAAESYAHLGFLSLPYEGEQGPLATQQYRRAAELYQQAIEISQEQFPEERKLKAQCYYTAGYIYGRLREYDTADQAYAKAIELATDDAARA